MEDIRVTIVQSALAWENRAGNLQAFTDRLKVLKPGDTDLVVLPEMFGTGFTMNATGVAETMEGEAVSWMRALAAAKNAVITGSLVIGEEGKFYNRLVWMQPDGQCLTYDKRHLFRMAEENHTYTGGEKRIVTELKGWKICPLVCYDLRFPVWSRNNNEYDVLLYVANWPERRSYAWKHLLIARAIENQAYVVGVNRIGQDGKEIAYSGDSVVLDPKGEVLSSTKPSTESVETVKLSWKELEAYRAQFPVHRDADKFIIQTN